MLAFSAFMRIYVDNLRITYNTQISEYRIQRILNGRYNAMTFRRGYILERPEMIFISLGDPYKLLIAACACIVLGVITASVIRIKKGKPSIGCDGCCKNCGGCCHSIKEDDK